MHVKQHENKKRAGEREEGRETKTRRQSKRDRDAATGRYIDNEETDKR